MYGTPVRSHSPTGGMAVKCGKIGNKETCTNWPCFRLDGFVKLKNRTQSGSCRVTAENRKSAHIYIAPGPSESFASAPKMR